MKNAKRNFSGAASFVFGLLAVSIFGSGQQPSFLVSEASASPGPCTSAHQQLGGVSCYNTGVRAVERCSPTGNVRQGPSAGTSLHATYAYGIGILIYSNPLFNNTYYVGPQCGSAGTSAWGLTPQGWVSGTTVILG